MARGSLLTRLSDLEAGAPVSLNTSAPLALGTRAIDSKEPCSDTGHSQLNDRPTEAPKKKSSQAEFAGENGQALLLAFDNGKSGVSAIEVHVNRPSYQWSEAVLRKQSPRQATPEGVAKFREATEYESEECIWRRISEEWDLKRPKWQRYLPFLRPRGLEERMPAVGLT